MAKEREQTHICPICKRATHWEGNQYRPFCSERCKLVDLGKWASDEYHISGEKRDVADARGEENNQTEQ